MYLAYGMFYLYLQGIFAIYSDRLYMQPIGNGQLIPTNGDNTVGQRKHLRLVFCSTCVSAGFLKGNHTIIQDGIIILSYIPVHRISHVIQPAMMVSEIDDIIFEDVELFSNAKLTDENFPIFDSLHQESKSIIKKVR